MEFESQQKEDYKKKYVKEIKYCPICGGEIKEPIAKFCYHCGSKLNSK